MKSGGLGTLPGVEIPVPNRLTRTALIVWATIGVLILFAVMFWVMGQVRVIWLPLIFAFGITVLLDPIARAFQRISFPRVVAVVFAYLVAAVSLFALGSLVLPLINEQIADFGTELPDLYDQSLRWVTEVGANFGIQVETGLTADTIRDWLQDPANQESLAGLVDGFGAGAGRVLRGVAELVSVIGLAPVFAFYLLVDLDRTRNLLVNLTPPRLREEVKFVGSNLGSAIGGFVRGQLLVATIVGILSSVALNLLEVPFWLIIGLAAGLLNMIPFVGPFVGATLAALVALLDGRPTTALLAVGAFMVIQQTDNHLITPLVQRARVKLSPLVIVLSLLMGAAVAGLLGVLIAVPTVAAVRIVAGHLWRTRVLGESWSEASEAMIEVTPTPDMLKRRRPDQARLFDTAEMVPIVSIDHPPEPAPTTDE